MGKKLFFLGKVFSLLFFVLGFFFLSSCKPIHKETFVICGTYLEITSPNKKATVIVHEEFKRLDKIFNFYDPQSELFKLNNTYNTPFKASKELIEVLKLTQQVNTMTDGAFDSSYGVLYSFWKELIKKGDVKELPSKEKIAELKKLGGMANIEINEKEGTVLIKKEGLRIDCSGIATGYMVDKAILKLKEKGIKSAIVNAGGDIYCLGTNKGRFWVVGIKDPKEMEGLIENEALVDEGIATSGNYTQFFELDSKRYSHLIDPRTGYPVDNDILSVSVITKNCTSADSLGTAFFVMGLDNIKNFLSKSPSTMRIFVITWDKKGKHVHKFGI
ncbi:MAG: FAD:protein FMN transferase [Candidatus Omnitrophota bacterium]|nr:FAD:protein FMN transferase [Candidatus Omnitrophota bacterium]